MSGKSDYLTSGLGTGNSIYLTSQLTSIDPLRQEDDEFFGQGFISDFGIGSGNLVSGIGTLYGLASGNMDNAISRFGEETTSFYEDLQTEDQKRRQTQFQQYVDGGADEVDKLSRAFVGTITDPSLTFSFLTQQIPLLAGSGGAGLAVRGATGAVRAGQAAGVLSGAGLNAGDIAGSMYSEAMQVPEDVLDRNDAYRVRKAEIGAEEARKELALEGARNTGAAVGALSALTAGVLPSTIEKTLIGGVANNTTRIGNLGRGLVSEALQEAIEEGGGQAIANLNIQSLDPSRSLTEGVGQAVGQGGLLGGLMGGTVGGLSPTRSRIAEAAERGANKAREAGGDALDQSASAAQEAAQVSTTDTTNQSDIEALRSRFGINQGRVDPVTLTPAETTLQPTPFEPLAPRPSRIEGISDEDLAEIDLRAEVVPVQGRVTEDAERIIRANFGDAAGDRFAERIKERLDEEIAARQGNQRRVIETPNSRTVIETDSKEAADTAERQIRETEAQRQQQLLEAEAQRQQQQAALTSGVDLIGSLRASLNKAIITARREQRALGDSDPQQTQELEDDIGRLQFGLARLQEAQSYESEGSSAAVATILNQVRDIASRPILSPEFGRRQSFDYVNVLEGELMPRIDETIELYQQAGVMPQTERPALRAPADFEVDPEGSTRRPRSTTQQADIPDIQARDNLIEDQNIIYGDQPPPEPPPPGPALIENQNIIYGQPPADQPTNPARVTRVKTSGDVYPTAKSAEIAMSRLQREEQLYRWEVVTEGSGFAVQGNLINPSERERIKEVTPSRVIDQAQQDQRQVIEMENLPPNRLSIADEIAVFERGAGVAYEKLNGIEQKLNALTARDQSGLTKKNPALTVKDGDDLILTIVKLGGIDSDLAAANGFEPKLDNPRSNSVGRYRLFRKNGRTFDDLAISLRDEGWYPQADPNMPDTLSANDVMEDIREAVNLAQGNTFVYKSDKAASILSLENDKEFTQEMIDEFEALVATYRSEVGPEEAGLSDAAVLDSINYFNEVREEFRDEISGALPEGTATASRDLQTSERRGDSGAALEPAGGQPGATEATQAGSEESLATARSRVPPDVDQTEETETEPQGSVSRSGPLESYTEQDLQDRAAVDTEAGERRDQIDRERELFDLDSGEGTIAGTSDPTQTDGNQGTLLRRDRELGINRGATPRPVITDEEFNTVIDRVIGDNQEARARIVSVDSFADLPESLRIAARKQGSDGSDVDAVTHRGQIYIVRGRMRSKARMERTLLHEGTHVGINAMYADEGVRRAMNRMYVAMGGAKGFNQMAKDLGIERQIAPYREGLAREGASEKVRNEILVNEMLAYVGERGSKTFQDRVREVIGAIRNWLRKNGLMTLANMRVSDITYIAKKARENGLRSETAKGDGEPAFSIVAEQARARQTQLGLYSNAEQILLDQGDKIFKPSKKNPEGRVKGDQILSFLNARGLKKEEATYVDLEAELTDVASTQRFTREEVIQILRDNRPDLVADVRTGLSNEDQALIGITDAETLEDQENYQHIIDDMRTDIFDNGADSDDNFSLQELVTALFDYDKDIMKNMVSIDFPDMRLSGDSVAAGEIFESYVGWSENDVLPKRLVSAFGENLVDDKIVELAEQRYLDDPYYRHSVYSNGDEYIGEIIGNDDIGYILRDSAGIRFAEGQEIYDIDEARVQFQLWAEDSGLIGAAYEDGDTQYFEYLKIAPSDINDYREVVVSLEDNRLSDSTYHGGHFDVENMLFHVLATDRETELGEFLFIEETQSDWHSAIRKTGGTYDPARGEELQRQADSILEDSKSSAVIASSYFMEFQDEFAPNQNFYDIDNAGLSVSRSTSLIGQFLTEVAPSLTDAGIAEMMMIMNKKYPSPQDMEFPEKSPNRLGMVRDIMNEMADGPGSERFWTVDPDSNGKSLRSMLNENMQAIAYYRQASTGLLDFDPMRFLGRLRETQQADDRVEMGRNQAKRIFSLEKDAAEKRKRAHKMMDEGRALKFAPPDSPFRDDKYLELVAKIMLRDAITERKAGIGFSKADRVQNRWSEQFDYEAIYNRKLKKAMDKLMGMPAQSMDEQGRIETGDDVSSDGFWVYEITPELAENVRENGLPMFRRDGSDGRIYPKKPAEERMRDKFLRVLQDKMLPVYRTQQAIEVDNERELDVSENPYLTEELFYGKTEEDLRQIELRFVEPLIRAMKEAGVSSDQLNDYLYAKHAPERNRVIREEINPEFEGPGSGMSDAEAAEILGQYTGEKLQQMEDLADRVYQMTQLTRDLLRASGLQSDEMTDSWEATYENYVPLRGFADNEVDAKGGRVPTGRGFDIRGKEAKRAYGRQSRAQGPLAQVIADLTGKIIRNRKNEVSKAFLQMVENNPDPSQWQVFTDDNPDPAALRGPNANKRTAQMAMARDDAYLGVKRDGVVHYIKVKDRKLLNAMQNVGPEQMDVATRFFGGITRFLSSVNTAYDPTFVLTNFARDIQAALINIAGEQTKEGGLIEGERIGAKVAKGTPRAVGAIRNYVRNKKVDDGDSEYERYFKEFLDVGAKTGYFDSPDLDVLEKRLAARINQGEGTLARGKAGAKWIGEFVSDYNLAVENGVRLSAYIESRKAGIDKSKAASLAKNLTVNFNRKGSAGAHINSWYMFFNAAVQGLKQFTNTLSPITLDAQGNVQVQRRLNRAQKIAGSLVGIAYAAAVFNREIGGEDDDGESLYDKINPAIRERNLILMKPGYGEIGDDGFLSEVAYFKIPLPYGYNFFYTIGTAVEAIQNGSARRKENALGEVFNSFVTAFSPISVHADARISGLPTVFVPGAELLANTNFFGSDIVRENFPSGPQRAAAHNYWNSTKEPYVAIAQFLNDTVGGGSTNRSGSMGFMFDVSTDISPDTLEHIMEFGLGGIYRAGTGALDAVERVTSDRDIDPTRVPFLSKVLGRDDSDYVDQERFYDTRQLIINAKDEREDARGQERIESDQANNFIHRLYPQMLSTEKFLRLQRDRRDTVRDDDRLTEAERDAKLEQIRDRMDARIDRFNKRYQEHLEKYGT